MEKRFGLICVSWSVDGASCCRKAIYLICHLIDSSVPGRWLRQSMSTRARIRSNRGWSKRFPISFARLCPISWFVVGARAERLLIFFGSSLFRPHAAASSGFRSRSLPVASARGWSCCTSSACGPSGMTSATRTTSASSKCGWNTWVVGIPAWFFSSVLFWGIEASHISVWLSILFCFAGWELQWCWGDLQIPGGEPYWAGPCHLLHVLCVLVGIKEQAEES